jgi:chemotaxis signal transduction protein
MSSRDALSASLDEIREAFDATFAAAPPDDRQEDVPLLAIRVGNDAVALRVHDTLGLLKAGRIVPVPSGRAELLGITGVRGAVIPVYSLARLTGRAEGESTPWIVLAGAGERIGLAFAEFQGHLRVPVGAVHATASPRGTVAGLVELTGQARPILDTPAIVRAITRNDQRTG